MMKFHQLHFLTFSLVVCLSVVETQSPPAVCIRGCSCEISYRSTLFFNSVYCVYTRSTSQVFMPPPTLALHIHGQDLVASPNLTAILSNGFYLVELQLYSFYLHRLTEDALPHLPNLEILNITYSETYEISPGLLQRLPKLRILGLHGNNFFKIPNALTCIALQPCDARVANQLEELSLRSNSLRHLQDDSFIHLTNLKSLNLGENRLSSLQEDIFSPLQNLQFLHLHCNHISNLPQAVFQNLTKLQILRLGSNALRTLDSGIFQNLSELEVLDLSLNQLTTLPVDIFTGLHNLLELNLRYNNVLTLPRDIFQGLHLLRYVDLSEHYQTWSWSPFPLDLLRNLPSLKTANLKDTGMQSLENLTFEGCTSLIQLDLSFNFIHEIPRDVINSVNAPSVKYLTFKNNNISTVAQYAYAESDLLTEINLAHNSLSKIVKHTFYRLKTLQILDLSHNNIMYLDNESLYHLPSLQQLKLNYNRLKNVNLFHDARSATLINLYMDGNPLSCDCDMFAVFYNATGSPKLQDLVNLKFVPGLTSLKCHSPSHAMGQYVGRLDPQDFWCAVPELCPDSCTCYRVALETAIFITNCSFQGFQDFPTGVWQNTTVLILQGNGLTHISKSWFTDLTALQELNLQMNSIAWIEEGAFGHLTGLQYLDLSFNKLSDISGSEFTVMTDLKYLYLNFNNISHIDAYSFINLRTLDHLMLDHNRLEYLDVGMFNQTTALLLLSLDSNPYVCTCQLWWVDLKEWLQAHIAVIPYIHDINCTTSHDNSTETWPILQLTETDLGCNDTDDYPDIYKHRLTDTESRIIACVLGFTAIAMVTTAAVFRFRTTVRVVIYNVTGWRVLEKAEVFEENKTYDAFLSFSSDDLHWVKNTLLKNLEEHDPPYKVCIHHRDFVVGACIAENIVDAIEQSSRTILVLTNHFLESEWCAYEFKQAHHQVLTDKSSSLIVLYMEDIDRDKLDRELKTYLETNTYLEKDDPLFWEKLYYAMPHVKHIRKLNRPKRRHRGPHALDQILMEVQGQE